MSMKRNYLKRIVTFGGKRMTYGAMVRRLQKTAKATGHPNPQALVDRYLQGWEAGLTLADHAELWCQEQGRKLPPRGTPEWTQMYQAWHDFAFEDFRSATLKKSQPRQRPSFFVKKPMRKDQK